jgi:sterol desaturase/sphingolipid hydroxylase (fatty acid hydroxylase superfamily)
MLRAMMRRVLAWTTYPLVTGGSLVLCVLALARGWPVWAIGVVVVTCSAAVVELLERIIPYSRAWTRERGDKRTDLWHFAISNRAFDLGTFAAIGAMAPLGRWVSARIGAPLFPHQLPLFVQAALALALVELPWYWIHRLEHRWVPLWRVHSVHHSSERLYWWNVNRNHPIDNLVSAVASMAPLALLGVGEAPLALVAAFSGANAMLQHSNVDMRTGVLDLFFTTARVHRWHHSRKVHEANANYGPTLTLWDWVFGTRRFDASQTPPENVGLANEETFPSDFVGQLRAPFDRALFR